MVVSGGPSIVDEGLVLHLDAGDRACYRGEPTTNLMPHTNGITGRVGWPGGAYTHSIETTGDYAGWEKMVVTSTGSISNAIMRLGDVTCSPGTVYTAIIEYYAPYANLKFNISGAHGNYSPVRIGDTNKYYLTFTFGAASAGSMGWWLLTTASTPANTAITNGVIYYRRVQFEQKSYYTDFTIGTRGSTVATGGGLLDLTNNGNNGEINRTSVPASAFYNSGNKGYFSFDGSNDYIDLGSALDFSQEVTINAIIKPLSGTGQYGVIAQLNRSDGNHWQLAYNTDSYNISFGVSGTSYGIKTTQGSTTLIPYGQIAVLTATYNNNGLNDINNYEIKLNTITCSKTALGSTGKATSNNTIGWRKNGSSNNYFKGSIYSILIYNRILSQSEIEQNYHATKGRFL